MKDRYEAMEQAEEDALVLQYKKNQYFKKFILGNHYEEDSHGFINSFRSYVVERSFNFEGDWEEVLIEDLAQNYFGELSTAAIHCGCEAAMAQFAPWCHRQLTILDIIQSS